MQAAQASAVASQQSAEAAIKASTEAAKARVDSSAPQLVVRAELTPGALIDPSRQAMPGAGELRMLDQRSIQQSRDITYGEVFIFDRDAHLFIWFRITGVVRNEGRASAKVRLDGEAQFEGTDQGDEIVLRPDEERAFEWAAGFPAKHLVERRLAPQGARAFLVVTGVSFAEDGVVEMAHLEFMSRALQPVQDHQGAFTFSEWPDHSTIPWSVATVYPTLRAYPWDVRAGKYPEPPWPPDDPMDAG